MKSIVLIMSCFLFACGADATTNIVTSPLSSTNRIEVGASVPVREAEPKDKKPAEAPSASSSCDEGRSIREGASGTVAFLYFACLLIGIAVLGWYLWEVVGRTKKLVDTVADAAATTKTILRHTSGVDDMVDAVVKKINEGNERLFNALKVLVSQELAEKNFVRSVPTSDPNQSVNAATKQSFKQELPIVASVRTQFSELTEELTAWAAKNLEGVEVISSSLHVLTTMTLVDDETWLMALRNISIGLSYVSKAMGETEESNVSRMAKWGKVLSKMAKDSRMFSISVPSLGSKIDYSWMTPINDNGKTDVSGVRSWAVYTAYGVRHNAEVM